MLRSWRWISAYHHSQLGAMEAPLMASVLDIQPGWATSRKDKTRPATYMYAIFMRYLCDIYAMYANAPRYALPFTPLYCTIYIDIRVIS